MAEYTLTYDIQGGVGDVPEGGEFEEGAVVVLDDGDGLTKEGFEFGGWSLEEDGEPIDGDFEMPDEDTTVFAVWVEEVGEGGDGEGGEPGEGDGEGDGEDDEGQPADMSFDDFIAECDRIIAIGRDLKDARDSMKGIEARQVVKETAQDKLMGIREEKVVKIRNYGFTA